MSRAEWDRMLAENISLKAKLAEVDPYETGIRMERLGRAVEVDLVYPRGRIDTIEIGLEDVRAADSILVRYDFERDGWSISQASRFSWAVVEVCDPDWQEVAFVQAWARDVGEQ